MLAMADKHGRVWGSIPGLANRAQVPVESTRAALSIFMAPDPDSRTKDHEGRRIREIDGGWSLLNHGKYRAIRDDEERRAYKAGKEREYRAKRGQTRGQNGQAWTGVDRNGHNADTDTDLKPSARKPRSQVHPLFGKVKERIFAYYRSRNSIDPEWNGMEAKQLSDLLKANPTATIDHWNQCLKGRYLSEVNHSERPGLWLSRLSSFKNPINGFNRPLPIEARPLTIAEKRAAQ